MLPSLVEAFACRSGRRTETSFRVAAGNEIRVLVENRLADVALGPYLGAARRENWSASRCSAPSWSW
ncbi:hypothetical protein O1M54_07595 [Streptomyces diastatochromogenes]|nr:hypothetical protein [Streptomyces diastatochromogenes]